MAARELLSSQPVFAKFELFNSFADTGNGHRTHMGLVAGALGIQPSDQQTAKILLNANDVEEAASKYASQQGLEVQFTCNTDLERHPNFLRISLSDGAATVEVSAISVGGGSFEILEQNLSKPGEGDSQCL